MILTERLSPRSYFGHKTQRNKKREKKSAGTAGSKGAFCFRRTRIILAAAALLTAVILLSLGSFIVRTFPARYEIRSETGKAVDPVSVDYMPLELFSLGARDEVLIGGNIRSDYMITASISKKTTRILLLVLSLYIDTELNTRDNVCTRGNAAYARDGPERAFP